MAQYDYDTQALRRVAQEVRTVSAEVTDVSAVDLSMVQQTLEGNFEGLAAKALDNVLEELIAGVKKISRNLDTIGNELNKYADSLDQADQEAAAKIRNS